MDIIALKDYKDIAALTKLVSKKQKAILAKRTTSVRISCTYWDEGSKSEYHLIHIASKRVVPLAAQAPYQYGGLKEDPIQLIEKGYAVVEAGTFCGKPATPVVYLHPEEEM